MSATGKLATSCKQQATGRQAMKDKRAKGRMGERKTEGTRDMEQGTRKYSLLVPFALSRLVPFALSRLVPFAHSRFRPFALFCLNCDSFDLNDYYNYLSRKSYNSGNPDSDKKLNSA
jgi:hypothetical protein